MNKKYLLFIFILLRGADWLTTYLVTNDLSAETSPLVRQLSFGWKEIVIINLLIIIVISCLYIYWGNERSIEKIEEEQQPKTLREYYYGVLFKEKYNSGIMKLLTTGKVNLSVFLFFFINSLMITMIIMSFLVSVSNILLSMDIFILKNLPDSSITNILSMSNVFLFIAIFMLLVKIRFNKNTL